MLNNQRVHVETFANSRIMRAMWTYLVVSISLIMIVAGMQPSRVSTVGEEKPWSTGIPRSPSGFSGSSRRADCTFLHNLESRAGIFWEMRDTFQQKCKFERLLIVFIFCFKLNQTAIDLIFWLVGRLSRQFGTAATSDEVMRVIVSGHGISSAKLI